MSGYLDKVIHAEEDPRLQGSHHHGDAVPGAIQRPPGITTLRQWGKLVIPSGKHAGKTYEYIRRSPSRWGIRASNLESSGSVRMVEKFPDVLSAASEGRPSTGSRGPYGDDNVASGGSNKDHGNTEAHQQAEESTSQGAIIRGMDEDRRELGQDKSEQARSSTIGIDVYEHRAQPSSSSRTAGTDRDSGARVGQRDGRSSRVRGRADPVIEKAVKYINHNYALYIESVQSSRK